MINCDRNIPLVQGRLRGDGRGRQGTSLAIRPTRASRAPARLPGFHRSRLRLDAKPALSQRRTLLIPGGAVASRTWPVHLAGHGCTLGYGLLAVLSHRPAGSPRDFVGPPQTPADYEIS
jgi:hypothetical protein